MSETRDNVVEFDHFKRGAVQNAAVCAMEKLQGRMNGEAERVGFGSVEDADAFIKEIRTERIG